LTFDVPCLLVLAALALRHAASARCDAVRHWWSSIEWEPPQQGWRHGVSAAAMLVATLW